MIFARALNDALGALLELDERIVVVGEDIADPYGGAFKATRGLSTRFPSRVLTTPVSEAAIAGIAAGLALSGYRPIVEIMFGDFVTLCFDQVVNHMAKYGAMYDGQATCPVIIRTPSGGGRGYGPTHSQSLEKHFLGVPGLRVVAASLHHHPLDLFNGLLGQDQPALFVEHKLLYPLHLVEPKTSDLEIASEGGPDAPPTVSVSAVPPEDCTVTVVAYGYQAVQATDVVTKLAIEEELFVELLVPGQIAPLDWAPIQRSVRATGRLVTVEEGTAGWSWGTQIAEHVYRSCFSTLRAPVEIVTSAQDIIPSARHLEQRVLPSAETIEDAIRRVA